MNGKRLPVLKIDGISAGNKRFNDKKCCLGLFRSHSPYDPFG
jgi:hypothetical protein